MLTYNIKQNFPSVEEALANLDLALEEAKAQNAKVIKIIHGYGSGGTGGAIIRELSNLLPQMIRQKKIKDYIRGGSWNMANPKVFEIITKNPSCLPDEDLNGANIGITVLVL